MGVDFIREQSGKPWKKRWDKGLNRLKHPSLFDLEFSLQRRTVTADLESDVSVQIGDQVIIQCNESSTIISRQQQRLGEISSIPADIRAALRDCGGIALGTVERVGLFGSNVELSLQ